MKYQDIANFFNMISEYAKNNTTCLKVPVGSLYYDPTGLIVMSCNKTNSSDNNCKKIGECYKYKVTGIYKSTEETRKYCSAIHSEVNLINRLISMGINSPSEDSVIFVSRYPCLNCCKEICKFGFKKVFYCGRQEISDDVKDIFNHYNVDFKWFPEFDYEDDRNYE